MESTAFLDYLHEHGATSDLSTSLAEILGARRASAARRRARIEPGTSVGVRIAS